MTKILFSIPTFGEIDVSTSYSLARIVQHPAIDYFACSGSPTDQVRNGLVRQMLKNPDYTHLMMLDSDMQTPDNIVDLMLECQSPMAAGIVPICLFNQIVSNIVINDEHGERFMTYWEDKKEPFEVEGAGTGVVLIAREVFEKVPWPWFRYKEGNADGKRFGEDLYFSRKAKGYGFKYKVHPKSVCHHFKKMDLLKLVNAWNGRRADVVNVLRKYSVDEKAIAEIMAM